MNVERLNPDAALLQVFLRGIRRQPEARPIGGGEAAQGAGFRHDVAADDQPLQGFKYVLTRKCLLQRLHELVEALPALGDQGGKRAKHLPMQKEFPVLRVEAQSFGR